MLDIGQHAYFTTTNDHLVEIADTSVVTDADVEPLKETVFIW